MGRYNNLYFLATTSSTLSSHKKGGGVRGGTGMASEYGIVILSDTTEIFAYQTWLPGNRIITTTMYT